VWIQEEILTEDIVKILAKEAEAQKTDGCKLTHIGRHTNAATPESESIREHDNTRGGTEKAGREQRRGKQEHRAKNLVFQGKGKGC